MSDSMSMFHQDMYQLGLRNTPDSSNAPISPTSNDAMIELEHILSKTMICAREDMPAERIRKTQKKESPRENCFQFVEPRRRSRESLELPSGPWSLHSSIVRSSRLSVKVAPVRGDVCGDEGQTPAPAGRRGQGTGCPRRTVTLPARIARRQS